MSRSTPMSSLALALGLCLLLPLGVAAQSGVTEEAVPLPELDGLAWYRSIDLSGEDMQATLSEEEVAEWAVMVDMTGATFDQLEYTYQTAFRNLTAPFCDQTLDVMTRRAAAAAAAAAAAPAAPPPALPPAPRP